jgi:hypothetical protein
LKSKEKKAKKIKQNEEKTERGNAVEEEQRSADGPIIALLRPLCVG